MSAIDDLPCLSLAQRASIALRAADAAFLAGAGLDMPAADRAEHARRAHHLAAYARELLAVAVARGESVSP